MFFPALAPRAAFADPVAYSGESGLLMPVKNGSIEMLDEVVKFQVSGKVTAEYTFYNSTGEELEVLMGFPMGIGELKDPGASGSPPSSPVKGFKVKVDGKAVSHMEKKTDCVDDGDKNLVEEKEDLCYDFVYLFNVTFPPAAKVVVECSYTQSPSSWETGGKYFSFILRTGAM
jgi:hypothetical protein